MAGLAEQPSHTSFLLLACWLLQGMQAQSPGILLTIHAIIVL